MPVRLRPLGGPLVSPSTGLASFETNRFYQPGLLEAPDMWLWEALGSGATRTKSFSLSGVDAASAEAAGWRSSCRGVGVGDHGRPPRERVAERQLVGEAKFAGKQPTG